MTKMIPLLQRNEQFAAAYPPGPLGPPAAQVAAESTGMPEAALEAAAVAGPHTSVRADVERLLAAPWVSPQVSVSGHVYDISTGRVTTVVDARHPQPAVNN
jgi:carbonic anhydrase